jgi:hypothetical protein
VAHVEVHLLTAAMTAADQMKLGVWPCLGQVPGGIGGPAEVKTAVYENPRYSRESVRVAKKLAILDFIDPGPVADAVPLVVPARDQNLAVSQQRGSSE